MSAFSPRFSSSSPSANRGTSNLLEMSRHFRVYIPIRLGLLVLPLCSLALLSFLAYVFWATVQGACICGPATMTSPRDSEAHLMARLPG